MKTHFRLLLSVTLICPLFAGCSVTAKFKPTTTAIQFDRGLLPHETCLPGSLELRATADMFDDEFNQELASTLRTKVGDVFKAGSSEAREQGKLPQYIINITQMTENSKFDGNEEAAIYGAVFGGGAGAVAGGRGNRVSGAGIGAVVVGALSWLAAGDKTHQYHFMVNIQQMTSKDGIAKRESMRSNAAVITNASKDADVGTVVGTGEAALVKSGSNFDGVDNYYKQHGAFMVTTAGGVFTTEAEAIAAVKKRIIEKLPGFLAGGERIM